MARNRVHVEAPPERVFAVLPDPERYPEWIVGAAAIERSEADFPAPGSRFWHRVGSRRLGLCDHTEVRAVDPPRRIELKAKARPLGYAAAAREALTEGGLRRGLGAGEVGGGHGARGSLAVRALRGWDGLLCRAVAG